MVSCPFLLLGALATPRLRAPAPIFLPTLPRWRLMTPRRPRPTGSGLRLLCWWRSLWAFCHILLYYCSDNARSALETGRPATSGNRLSINKWTGSSPVVGWGSSSTQGETAVTPIFDSDTCVSRVFLPFSAAWGSGYAQAPRSRTCLSFPPTGSLFCGVVFLPTLPR